MLLLARIGSIISGILLLLIVFSSNVLRQQPSTAFWVLGHLDQSTTQSIVLSSPNSNLQRTLIAGRLTMINWLPDNKSFLHLEETESGAWQLHQYILATRESHYLADHFPTSNSQSPHSSIAIKQIPQHEQVSFILNHDEGQAIFSLDFNNRIIQQITVYHDNIDPSFQWSLDGEWVTYIASDVQNPPHGIFRQRVNDRHNQEIMRFRGEGYQLMGAPDSNSVLVGHVSGGFGSSGIRTPRLIYRILLTDSEPQLVTPENEHFNLYAPMRHGWIILEKLSNSGTRENFFRVHIDSGEADPLLPKDIYRTSINMNYLDTDNHVYISTAGNGNSATLYQVNVATLKYVDLIPDHQFRDIQNVRVVKNTRYAIFEGRIEEGTVGRFLFDRSNQELTMLSRLRNFFSSPLIISNDGVGLVLQEDESSVQPITHVQHVSIDTNYSGGYLTTLNTPLYNIRLDYFTYYIDGYILLSINPDTALNNFPKQYRINLDTGDIQPVLYGNDALFSGPIDFKWQQTPLVTISIGLLIIATIGSIGAGHLAVFSSNY